jgi:hypothetical protein
MFQTWNKTLVQSDCKNETAQLFLISLTPVVGLGASPESRHEQGCTYDAN